MAKQKVLVLGRFRGGVLKKDIHAQLKAQGHKPVSRVRLATVVIAGLHCGERLSEAEQAGLTILDQYTMLSLIHI